jgi:hypothetical protein
MLLRLLLRLLRPCQASLVWCVCLHAAAARRAAAPATHPATAEGRVHHCIPTVLLQLLPSVCCIMQLSQRKLLVPLVAAAAASC